jgi:threonine/homoserine/homoserine lactone efflux protein
MISFDALLSFLFLSFVLELTPGPNMAYLAVISVGEGRRAGFAAVAGIALGLLAIGLLASFGVAAFISESPLIDRALRWTGVLYLLWLAWDGWRTEKETSPGRAAAGSERARYFRRGFVTNCLNPKAMVFYVAVLPTFIDPGFAAMPQAVLLTFVYVAVASVIHGTIVGLGGFARTFLGDHARTLPVRRAMSLLLVGIALWFAWETAR